MAFCGQESVKPQGWLSDSSAAQKPGDGETIWTRRLHLPEGLPEPRGENLLWFSFPHPHVTEGRGILQKPGLLDGE